VLGDTEANKRSNTRYSQQCSQHPQAKAPHLVPVHCRVLKSAGDSQPTTMNEVQYADGWRQRVYKENRRAEELRTTLQQRELALYGPPRLTLAKAGARRVVHQHAHPCSPLHSHGTNAARTVFNCSICGAYNAVR
jgi:hypothetical protein